jgi:hypothetical protein
LVLELRANLATAALQQIRHGWSGTKREEEEEGKQQEEGTGKRKEEESVAVAGADVRWPIIHFQVSSHLFIHLQYYAFMHLHSPFHCFFEFRS